MFFARLQLLAFLAMLLLSFTHVHQTIASSYDTCLECVNHVRHEGHLSLNIVYTHDCVVCQFLTLSFLAAFLMIVGLQLTVSIVVAPVCSFVLLSAGRQIPSLRAPPVY